ncbi:DUF4839 domain-containing protein [Promicromonospora sp. NPDC052451]|uniref:DUF4839 domain-containing protein n=1 Tax=Promicromonospora sp. NPDC052451 TaxID=3364407 RepID=UPI0037C61650
MADEDVLYEFKTVHAIRGTEARSIAKWQKSGWALVDQNQGTLRTTLSFRRPKPKLPWVPLAVAGGVLALLAVVIGIGIALEDDGGVSELTMRTSEKTVLASESPSGTPEPSTSASASPDAGQTDADQVLTIVNNKEFAALLSVGDTCDESIARFANKYAGETIEFDGSIADMVNHGSYDTRYDILLGPGDKGPETGFGPAFKFEDVNFLDLRLTGANKPDYVGAGDRLHLIAEVGEFNPVQCLFLLEPVSTEAR